MKYEKIHRFRVHEDCGRHKQMYYIDARETFVTICKARYIVRGFFALTPFKVKRILRSRWKGVNWNRKYYE